MDRRSQYGYIPEGGTDALISLVVVYYLGRYCSPLLVRINHDTRLVLPIEISRSVDESDLTWKPLPPLVHLLTIPRSQLRSNLL